MPMWIIPSNEVSVSPHLNGELIVIKMMNITFLVANSNLLKRPAIIGQKLKMLSFNRGFVHFFYLLIQK